MPEIRRASEVKNHKRTWLTPLAQKRPRHNGNGNAASPQGGKCPVMRVPVQRDCGLVTIERPLQPRAAQKRKDRLRLAHHRFPDRRVMGNRDLDIRLQLRKTVIQLDRLALRNLDKRLDAAFAEGHQLVWGESSGKALGARKADAVDFKTLPVQQM